MRYTSPYPSPLGTLTLLCDESALLGLWIQGQKHFPEDLSAIPGEPPVMTQAKDWLSRYFQGACPHPSELSLDPAGTAFQKQVWSILLSIPYGSTMTYGEIAAAISPTMSAQAVGGAVGRNPVSIVIPCHRVLGAGGQLTGYDGGIEKKRWLLRHEGISP